MNSCSTCSTDLVSTDVTVSCAQQNCSQFGGLTNERSGSAATRAIVSAPILVDMITKARFLVASCINDDPRLAVNLAQGQRFAMVVKVRPHRGGDACTVGDVLGVRIA